MRLNSPFSLTSASAVRTLADADAMTGLNMRLIGRRWVGLDLNSDVRTLADRRDAVVTICILLKKTPQSWIYKQG